MSTTQTIDFNNVDSVVFNGQQCSRVDLDGVTIFPSADEYVLNITTLPYRYDSSTDYTYSAYFYVEAGAIDCVITFNGETQTVAANSSASITFDTDGEYTGNITFRGRFVKIYPKTRDYYTGSTAGDAPTDVVKINSVVKWYKKLDYTFENMFSSFTNYVGNGRQTIDFNVTIPNYIQKIYSPFMGCAIDPASTISFSTTADIGRFDYRGSNTFSNVTVTNNIHIYNGIAIDQKAGGASGSPTTEVIIPTGVSKLARGLFSVCGPIKQDGTSSTSFSTAFGNDYVKKISFASPVTITKIPEYFATSNYLQDIEIPASVQEIGDYAFYGNTNIKSITFYGIGVSLGYRTFYNKSAKTVDIYTDDSTLVAYDWSGNENVTATFYHLNGTPWS